MSQESLVGFGMVFAFVAVVVKITVLVYFFILMNRLVNAVESIRKACKHSNATSEETGA